MSKTKFAACNAHDIPRGVRWGDAVESGGFTDYTSRDGRWRKTIDHDEGNVYYFRAVAS